MKSRIYASALAVSLLLSSSAFAWPWSHNAAKEQCKATYKQELSTAKSQNTHGERKAAERLAKAHYKDCKHNVR